MRTRNLNPLFNPLEFELKYQLLLGLVGAVSSWVMMQESVSIYVKALIGVFFIISVFMIHNRMIKELRAEPQVKKGYLIYTQVRFWSIAFMLVFFMLFFIGMEYFI